MTVKRIKIKTTAEPLRCPVCGKPCTGVKIIRVVPHDGGIKEYTLVSRTKSCGHTFSTITVPPKQTQGWREEM